MIPFHTIKPCNCAKCAPIDYSKPETVRMIVCPDCGDKRCPHAADHELPCTKNYGLNAWIREREAAAYRRGRQEKSLADRKELLAIAEKWRHSARCEFADAQHNIKEITTREALEHVATVHFNCAQELMKVLDALEPQP